MILGGPDTLDRFSDVFKRVTTCGFQFVFLHTNPFWKRVYSKRKEFAPQGSKFFPFRVDAISEERQKSFENYLP